MTASSNSLSHEIWDTNYRAPGEAVVADTFNRWATAGSSVEKPHLRDTVYQDFLWLFSDYRGMPGGRVMANLGVDGREATTLMNCFVNAASDIPGEYDIDSIGGIFRQLERQAHTLKSEGGYGHNFSYVRPSGAYVQGIGSSTPGVVAFMGLWNESSRIITQGSTKQIGKRHKLTKKKIRKGAMMGVLDVWHPDIRDFIVAKQNAGVLDKFNLSVGITEGFMDAVNSDSDWVLRFPDTTFEKYKSEWFGNIIEWEQKGYPTIAYETVKAKEIWDLITYSTYTRNEPGILFLDVANKLNPLYYAENVKTTNPCGEIAMSTGVCNLLSINLAKFVVRAQNGRLQFDMESFKRAVAIGVRFSDNINDISRVPLDEYRDSMQEKRRIGVGVLGLASLLMIIGVRYGSDESLDLIEQIFKAKAETEILTSAKLGAEKGSFTLFDAKQYFSSQWWRDLRISKEVKAEVEAIGEMRNSHRSANAPTGNMGIFAEVTSGGIEPVFMKSYIRWSSVIEEERARLSKEGFVFPDVTKGEWFETDVLKFAYRGDEQILRGSFGGKDYEVDKGRGLINGNDVVDYGWRVALSQYTQQELEKLDAEGAFATTDSLSVSDHIRPLEIIAHYTDMNSSKTINLPAEYPYEDFQKVYMDAWKAGIKGVTTYRAGTMTAVLEAKKEQVEEEQEKIEEALEVVGVIQEDVKLPTEFVSKGYIIKPVEDGVRKKWYVNIAFSDTNMKRPFAIFVNTNSKEGYEVTGKTITELMTLAQAAGIKQDLVDDQIKKMDHQTNVIKIARALGFLLRHNVPLIDVVDVLDKGNYPLSSFTFHIKRLLKQFIPDGVEVQGKKCSSCGSEKVVMQEGCFVCMDCGSSKCG